MFSHHGIDTISLQSPSMLAYEECWDLWLKFLPLVQIALEQSCCLIIEKDDSSAAFLELTSLQRDRLFNPVYVTNIHGDQFASSYTCLGKERHYCSITGVYNGIDEETHLFHGQQFSW